MEPRLQTLRPQRPRFQVARAAAQNTDTFRESWVGAERACNRNLQVPGDISSPTEAALDSRDLPPASLCFVFLTNVGHSTSATTLCVEEAISSSDLRVH